MANRKHSPEESVTVLRQVEAFNYHVRVGVPPIRVTLEAIVKSIRSSKPNSTVAVFKDIWNLNELTVAYANFRRNPARDPTQA
jgi:hypothetical protein